ncbi:hypothetical protein [Nocardia seriolae]|uniref:Uncharacterized protein n=1 Tax=Nocardia seriolae TaxID=37332 RepID=A0A0B8NCL4_9NOCA|nr:hypothetical protein [Nocardia seriolae]MTJ60962.1 hypothetical protein [Nocardia seriolae]MTJ71519.1 hypothetical protein [Nocardia seriolae]MTJ90904.1 hypothetical protein [Nocardia seriolae]MTK34860.1 hypothetical protein [Nocardia seriolae]MTK38941.1 hypothetical protein [Nocardia seriolae]
MSSPFDQGSTGAVQATPTAATGQSVADALRDTDFAPLLDSPVGEVLQTLGLPALPQLPAMPPLPDMPPLPTLDLTALTKPLTDLASSFGTGQLGQGVDASQVLSGISSALQQVMSIAQSVMSLAGSDSWQGSGAAGAAEKGTAAQTDAVELEGQNLHQKTVMGGAATPVATGAAMMSAIITKFVTGITMAAPFIATPPGQAFLLALATETGSEATAVVAKTRTEMAVHSANMTTAGQKVKVTNAPTGVDSMSQVTQLLSLISPLSSAASTGVQQLQQLQSISQTTQVEPGPDADPAAAPKNSDGLGALGAGGLAPMGGLGVPAATPAPVGASSPRTMSATTTPPAPVPTPLPSTGATGMGAGMVPPMGAMGASAQAGDADEEVRTNLVTAEHGDEVVGEMGYTGVPVVGAVGTNGPRPAQ